MTVNTCKFPTREIGGRERGREVGSEGEREEEKKRERLVSEEF